MTRVFRLDASGALLETFLLDEDHPAYLTNAVLAGGRIAVTWVATDAGTERHYLRWYSCP